MLNKRFIFLKLLNIVTLIIFVCFWGFLAVGLTVNYVEKNYIYPLGYKQIVIECSDYYGLDRGLVFSVIKTESNFKSNAESQAGAIGLMQITPKTADYIAEMLKISDYDLLDAYTNVWFGCYYLKYLLNKFNLLNVALCAYNAGEGNVALWLNNQDYSTDKINLSVIPFKETKEYVAKILKTYKKYSELYGNILDKR